MSTSLQPSSRELHPDAPPLVLKSSPHARHGMTTDQIMLNVVYAMLPICILGVYWYGFSALLLLLVCTGSAVLTEHLFCRFNGRATTVNDYSAVITGMLLALTLPPAFPLWMGAMGGFISIALGKLLFGGLGYNVFNPALVGRAFLQAAFPVAITTWSPVFAPGRFSSLVPSTLAAPFMKSPPVLDYYASIGVDGFTGATPFSLMKFQQETTAVTDLFMGTTPGSLGETSDLVILLCGLYLVARRMMNWRIPASMLGSVFVLSLACHLYDSGRFPSPTFMLFSGGLMLGAIFMASDMVASPTTPKGVWIYGAFIGFVTVVIRLWGGLPEGVMYAILLGNAVSPLIDQLTQPRIFGARKKVRTT